MLSKAKLGYVKQISQPQAFQAGCYLDPFLALLRSMSAIYLLNLFTEPGLPGSRLNFSFPSGPAPELTPRDDIDCIIDLVSRRLTGSIIQTISSRGVIAVAGRGGKEKF